MATLKQLLRRQRRAGRREVAAILDSGPSPSVMGDIGGFAADRSNRRIGSLVRLLDQGKLNQSSLGTWDRGLLDTYFASHPNRKPDDSKGGSPKILGIGGPIAESISNFWVGDNEVGLGLGPMALQIPASLIETGKAIASDIGKAAEGKFDFVENPIKGKNLPGPLNLLSNFPGVAVPNVGKGNSWQSGAAAPLPKDSAIKQNIVDPVLQNYKQKYSGSLGDIVNKAVVKDPAGTLLDVGTAVTLGAMGTVRAGSGLSKVGENVGHIGRAQNMPRVAIAGDQAQNLGQRMAGILTQEGRSPIRPHLEHTRGGADAPSIDRLYSTRPVMKASQKLSDFLLERTPVGRIPTGNLRGLGEANYVTGNTLRETRDLWHGIKRDISDSFSNSKAVGAMYKATESRPFRDAIKKLPQKQRTALMLAKNGINFQRVRGSWSAVDSYRDTINRSLEGRAPAGYNVSDLEPMGVDRKYVEFMRDSLNDPEVLEYIRNPTDEMVTASNTWDDQVTRTLSIENIDPEAHQRRVFAGQTLLRVDPERLQRIADQEGVEVKQLISDPERMMEIANISDPAASFARFAEGQEGNIINPNYIPHMVARGEFSMKRGQIRLKDKRGKRQKKATAAEEVIEGAAAKDYLKHNEFQSFLSGAMRVDTGVIFEHIAQRERMLANNSWLLGVAERMGGKVDDVDGGRTLAMATDIDEMRRLGFDDREWGLLNINGLFQFLEAETNVMKSLAEIIDGLKGESKATVANKFEELQKSMNEFLDADSQAAVQKMLSVTKPQKVVMPKTAINYIRDHFEAQMKGDVGFNHVMNTWRTFVLAYTPRWWLNTAVGSIGLSIMAGSMRPKYLAAAARYHKPEQAVELMKKHPELRYGLMGTESFLEDRRRNRLVDNRVADSIYTGIENMEGYFKKAGFFKFLDDKAKQAMREMGDTIEGYQRGVFTDEYLSNLLENHPRLVQAALNDTNKFFYNYNILGPLERRYVRKFIPFWGWYKFITKLTWQLPGYYPGKMNIVQKLGEVSDDLYDDEFGFLPPTMLGAIILNQSATGKASYIPTFGMNPFADFINPGEGMAGLLSASQFSPVIQAGAAAFGLDTFRGDGIQSSPDSSYGKGLFGANYNLDTGEEVLGNTWGPSPVGRFIGQGLRSIPQIRVAEEVLAGNRGVYSDSIPFVDMKPLPMESGRTRDTVLGGLIGGLLPREKDLRKYNQWREEDVKRARKNRKSELKRLKKAGAR